MEVSSVKSTAFVKPTPLNLESTSKRFASSSTALDRGTNDASGSTEQVTADTAITTHFDRITETAPTRSSFATTTEAITKQVFTTPPTPLPSKSAFLSSSSMPMEVSSTEGGVSTFATSASQGTIRSSASQSSTSKRLSDGATKAPATSGFTSSQASSAATDTPKQLTTVSQSLRQKLTTTTEALSKARSTFAGLSESTYQMITSASNRIRNLASSTVTHDAVSTAALTTASMATITKMAEIASTTLANATGLTLGLVNTTITQGIERLNSTPTTQGLAQTTSSFVNYVTDTITASLNESSTATPATVGVAASSSAATGVVFGLSAANVAIISVCAAALATALAGGIWYHRRQVHRGRIADGEIPLAGAAKEFYPARPSGDAINPTYAQTSFRAHGGVGRGAGGAREVHLPGTMEEYKV